MALAFHQIPDWISWENQGGNIAVFDLDKDGLPELIVLRIDHPTPGPNAGFYRVGKKLVADGTVGSWGRSLAACSASGRRASQSA